MYKKIFACTFLIAAVAVMIGKRQLSYPPSWSEIKVGMSRQEVYERTGPPTRDSAEVKGAFWYLDTFVQTQKLQVYFVDDRVQTFYISQQVGGAKDCVA